MQLPIKILHIIPQIGIGGAERQLHALIVNSDPKVVTHEVLYYSDSNDCEGFKLYDAAGIKYARVHRNKLRPVKFILTLAAQIRCRKPDLVHCWLYSGNIWGRWAANLAGMKNIVLAYRNCDLMFAPVLRILEKLYFNKVHFLANSKACAKFIAHKMGISSDRFSVIYNGLDPDKFDVSSIRQEILQEFNVPANVKLVTMVGRLVHQKNYPMFLKIAQKCKENSLPVHFLAVGHGQKENELHEMAKKIGVDDIVHFLGLRTDVPAVMKSSDMFCFTTLYEGFPNVLLEAMAAGLPIVTSDFSGADELIEDGVNGKIVKINGIDAAYQALKEYLDNPEMAVAIGQRARELVLNIFSMKSMINNTVGLYQKLLSKSAD